MNSKILLLAVTVAALSSCTTSYKTGQTPDDVYYSAAKPQSDERIEKKEEKKEYAYSEDYYDDRYLRMKVSNRYRWNDLNDWYSYDRYSTGYNYQFGSYYNPYNSWNYFYNPYCCCNSYINYGSIKYIPAKPIVRPTNFNLAGYKNGNYNNSNSTTARPVNRTNNTNPSYNNSNNTNSSRGPGKTIRTIFETNTNNSSSGNNNSSSTRTYTPSTSNSSSSSSSGSSGGSSGGGAVSRPGRN